MRILIVSNLYPPFYKGGYELRCAQVAEALHRQGHKVRVLASTYGLPASALGNIQPRHEEINGVHVYRYLNQYAFRPQPIYRPARLFRPRRELRDGRLFLKLLSTFRPDVVNWWSMYGLPKTLLPLPRSYGIPDVHWIEHWWMIREYGPKGAKAAAFWADIWDGNWGPRIYRPVFSWVGTRWEKRFEKEGIPTRSFPNSPRHVCFVSEYLRTLYREAELEFPSSEVIYGGVPKERFYEPARRQRDKSEPLRILYAGQISPDRGLHTVVEAIGHIAPSLRSKIVLSVAGPNGSNYCMDIRARIQALGIEACVSFLGRVPHEQMPQVYKQHDVFVFPSTRPEGLPLTMVEAMLAGCAVLTTGSGGAMEIATLAELPVFPKGDSLALSGLLARIAVNREEVSDIAAHGQKVALREFDFDRMMQRWNETLERLHNRFPPKEKSRPTHRGACLRDQA
jgi:glycogen(starch) synthase